MTAELHDIASARLRTTGQRYTTRRRALVEVLDEAEGPLTIPQILELDRSLAQSSAYRNLTELISAGVVSGSCAISAPRHRLILSSILP